MFRTAEAAGWTPEARYKTSLYSMMGRGGQSEEEGMVGDAGALARVILVRENQGQRQKPRARVPALHEPCRASLGLDGSETRSHIAIAALSPKRAIQRPVLDGFGDVFRRYGWGTFEVGYRSGYL